MSEKCDAFLSRRVKVVRFSEAEMTAGDLRKLDISYDRSLFSWVIKGRALKDGEWIVTDAAGKVHVLSERSFEVVCSE